MDIHIITKKDFTESDGIAKTRWWKIKDDTIKAAKDSGGSVYLHSRSHEPAFLGGKILDYRRNEEMDRIEIDFARDDDAHKMPWPKDRNVRGNPVAVVNL
jgi:hypothetical protein